MPNDHDIKHQVADALRAFASTPLYDAGLGLLDALGYKSELTLKLKGIKDFRETIDQHGRLIDKAAKVADWKNIEFLRQISGDDLSDSGQAALPLQEKSAFQSGFIKSYVFLAIELKNDHYTRTDLAQITRAVNRVFDMPAMILFKHGEVLTLSIINRRPHKREEIKDVLEKVTLIKDIQTAAPHRAHIEILFDLSVDELRQKHAFGNFDELHTAWQKTLDTKELNKRFFQELANWYFWALENVEFPDDIEKKKNVRNATNLIRLITRVVFIWFIKEKNLVPDVLFNKNHLSKILPDFNKTKKSDTYYRAILQNLFFGTLNLKMDERAFAKEGSFAENKNEYGVKNLFRYADSFSIKEKEIIDLFKDIPFLNGGLFDCLDKPNDDGKIIYIDGFSRNPKKQAKAPDYLFFSDEQKIDLNDVFGTKNKKYEAKGLINLLDSYKFTIAENTPIEEEIALDPELLGKVFENLLASYNPETQTTARKQTGSFYTPREIVNYMVDESLLTYLKYQLDQAGSSDAEARLRDLLSYSESPNPFNRKETKALIAAINDCNILDPACGSGAFPMGILHKMVHILHKLDPRNELWKQKQIEKAAQIDDPNVREHAIQDIEGAFENNELDYGRKLYLIENCIYGVDIQPLAVQIAKLRFFISLIIDENKQPDKENFGLRSLPNLETKFVAANALIGIESPEQGAFKNPEINKLENDLKQLRHAYFNAKTRKEKLQCQKKDKELRQQIARLLIADGWKKGTAQQVVKYDPYDQNASADFFDPEWMFGLREGFAITIGNPPYVRADSGPEHLAMRQAIIESKQYETLWEKWDLFIPFIERSYKLLKPGGVTTMIVSDAYCHSKYAQKSQNWFLKNSRVLRLDFLSKIKVFDAAVHNVVYFFQKAEGGSNKPERRAHEDEFGEVKPLPTDEQRNLNYRAFFPEDAVTQDFACMTITLEELCYISVGMVVNADEKASQGAFTLQDLISEIKDKVHPKPFVEGKDLNRWVLDDHKYIEWGTKRAPALFRRKTFPELYEQNEKLMLPMVGEFRGAIDKERLHCNHGIFVAVPWIGLKNVRNASIKKAARYLGEKPSRPDLPKREQLEGISRKFSLKFILGIVNSSSAKEFLSANRRNNVQLYPDDWKKLPIPDVASDKQTPIIKLVDEILKAKQADKSADVSAPEV